MGDGIHLERPNNINVGPIMEFAFNSCDIGSGLIDKGQK